jgi:hypothetical protein
MVMPLRSARIFGWLWKRSQRKIRSLSASKQHKS